MRKELIIPGVPRALLVDMWWLASETDAAPPVPDQRRWSGAEGWRGPLAALVGLVALADLLFYGHATGLSLAIFAGAIFGVVVVLRRTRDWGRPALLLTVAALPVVEYVQALSVGFLTLGLLASLVWVASGRVALGQGMLALAGTIPWRGVFDLTRASREITSLPRPREAFAGLTRTWALPVGGGLVLLGLLAAANPILEEFLAGLLNFPTGSADLIPRLAFWLGAGLLIWPLIAVPRPVAPLPIRELQPISLGLTAAAVIRALVLFNVLLAVQTGLDAVYLWGGTTLPEGMTAAEYARRGAYPLLVTALLAGAFALAARPFAREDRRLRVLLMLWLGQNVLLTFAALMRLDYYIDAFSLTYLRIYAGIWMAVVAAGLGLTGWQVWRDLPNRWLMLRCAAMGVGVLYLTSFVNFAAIIAAENLARDDVDGTYVCALGPTAAAAIVASGVDPIMTDHPLLRPGEGSIECQVSRPDIESWRDWGFRNWRVSRYLEQVPARS
ncbi:DUF4153 domain-containing protein [Tabrizicola sp.]|uniref:DUF4153 domain-containing protein n=1 Tax=Tabrizicola sp. TaxID=2005166 RepID=UPI003F390A39